MANNNSSREVSLLNITNKDGFMMSDTVSSSSSSTDHSITMPTQTDLLCSSGSTQKTSSMYLQSTAADFKLEDKSMLQTLKDVQNIQKDVINLNIGGVMYSTTRHTLCREPESMLAAMFSGLYGLYNPDDKNTVFIDRDGRHFRYLLNYLRTGKTSTPEKESEIMELLLEAEYYQLKGAIAQIEKILGIKKDSSDALLMQAQNGNNVIIVCQSNERGPSSSREKYAPNNNHANSSNNTNSGSTNSNSSNHGEGGKCGKKLSYRNKSEYCGTIGEALAKCEPGATIIVLPGTYDESLVIDKPGVSIIGSTSNSLIATTSLANSRAAERSATTSSSTTSIDMMGSSNSNNNNNGEWDCFDDFGVGISTGVSMGVMVYSSTSKSVFDIQASNVHISSMDLRFFGSHSAVDTAANCAPCVHVRKAANGVVIENCRITSFRHSSPAVKVAAESSGVVLKKNNICYSKDVGVLIQEKASCLVEDNKIWGNSRANIWIEAGACPDIRRNSVHNGRRGAGIWVKENAKPNIEDNDIFCNECTNIVVDSHAKPIVRRNLIHGGKENGIFVKEFGGGLYEENDISENSHPNLAIAPGADPIVRRNKIHDGVDCGIWVNSAKGTIEENEIFANRYPNITLSSGANPIIRRNKIHHGNDCGIWVKEDVTGTIEDNDIYSNKRTNIVVESNAHPHVLRNRIRDAEENGIYVKDNGRGVFEENNIYNNEYPNIAVAQRATPVFRRNKVHHGGDCGIWVKNNAGGIIEENDIYENACANILVGTGATAILRRNKIHHGAEEGVSVPLKSEVQMEDNDIFENRHENVKFTESHNNEEQEEGDEAEEGHETEDEENL